MRFAKLTHVRKKVSIMDIIEDLLQRGLLDNFSSKENVSELLKTKQTIYCGFDPSACSLQLGNFVMISVLARLQRAGHRIIAVIGGGTGMIGDPSGKKSERSFLNAEQVRSNVEAIKKQLSKYIDFSSEDKGILLDNYDWWGKINVVEFLRDYGKFFSLNYMLAKETVASRLEVGISYTEFSYMILQAGDYYRLHKEYGCNLQIGGGDQWGNLTASLELIRKREENSKAEVFSVKLITNAEGKKFGKSERGALYLDPSMTSPYFIYQYFINVSDIDVARYMKIFDNRSIEEIEKDIAIHNERPELRYGQKKLAYTIVSIVHSKEAADECVKMSEALFKDDFSSLSLKSLEEVSEGIFSYVEEGDINILDALIKLKLASSKREAREFVNAGSCKVNGVKITSLDYVLRKEDALYNKIFFVKRGKKLYAAIKY